MTDQVIYSATQRPDPGELMARQKRFERRKKAGNLALDANPHYLQVATWLLKLRFMTTEQLGRVLDPPRQPSTVFALLRRMYDAKLIARFDEPVKRKWGTTQAYGALRAVHCLDRAGAGFLADRFGVTPAEIDWQPRDNQRRGFLDHRLATNDVLITMYLAARQAGWVFDLVQTEREIHKKGGHDYVNDPRTGARRPVKADAVCRLTLAPSDRRVWLSLEVDMGTEGEKRIRQKFRLHRQYYVSGAYQARHDTKSNRVPFVVADVRDPLLTQPMDEADWRRRVEERVLTLKRWAEAEGMRWHFWFAPEFALTEETVWGAPVWWKAGDPERVTFL